MTFSNLARRLEEYDAPIESLRLIRSPATRQVAPIPFRPRKRRVRMLEVRDQGLRPFRVR